MSRTTYATPAQMGHILAALMPTNALIIRLCMATGLRVSDVLELRSRIWTSTLIIPLHLPLPPDG